MCFILTIYFFLASTTSPECDRKEQKPIETFLLDSDRSPCDRASIIIETAVKLSSGIRRETNHVTQIIPRDYWHVCVVVHSPFGAVVLNSAAVDGLERLFCILNDSKL